jgi:hypothetical protein
VDRVQAETILRQALKISADFEWSAAFFRSVAGDEHWPHYRRAVGQVMGEFYTEIMRPIERAYPELAPLIYESGLFEESQFPPAPASKQELAAHVRMFASAAAECVQLSKGVLGVSAPEVTSAAEHVSAMLVAGT